MHGLAGPRALISAGDVPSARPCSCGADQARFCHVPSSTRRAPEQPAASRPRPALGRGRARRHAGGTAARQRSWRVSSQHPQEPPSASARELHPAPGRRTCGRASAHTAHLGQERCSHGREDNRFAQPWATPLSTARRETAHRRPLVLAHSTALKPFESVVLVDLLPGSVFLPDWLGAVVVDE